MQPLAKSSIGTKAKILDTAERLFAEQGVGATSLRRIVAEADVNVASVHYHFGSKEELIRAVIRRRLSELSQLRSSELNRLKKKYADEIIPVRELLRAFIGPALAFGQDAERGGPNFARFVARMHSESDDVIQKEMFAQLHEVVESYLIELRRNLPHLDPQELSMRMAFMAGAMIQAILLPLKPAFVEYFSFEELSPGQLLDMLVAFCTAGFYSEGVEDE